MLQKIIVNVLYKLLKVKIKVKLLMCLTII